MDKPFRISFSFFSSVSPFSLSVFHGHEVIDMGYEEPIKAEHYIDSGRVTEFRYGKELSRGVLKNDGKRTKNCQAGDPRRVRFVTSDG